MRSILPYIIALVFLCTSCSDTKNVKQIEISETAGYDRVLEYVNASVNVERELTVEESILLTNVEDGTSILAANINSNLEMYQHKYDIIFPVKIGANQTNTYNVSIVMVKSLKGFLNASGIVVVSVCWVIFIKVVGFLKLRLSFANFLKTKPIHILLRPFTYLPLKCS
mgnify:CR=1 FL=1